MTQLLDHHADVRFEAGDAGIVRVQEIPDWFVDSLKDARSASTARAGETHRVCSVPAALVETWQRQGFDVMKEPARAIVKRLREQGFEHFIATQKAV